jgi:hypothetical protein
MKNPAWSALLSFLNRARKCGGRRRPIRSRRPTLERLEDRTLPTITGMGFFGMNYDPNQGVTPPDTILSAGPNNVVEAVNDNLFIGSKSTLPNNLSGSVQAFTNFFPGFEHSIFGLDEVITDPSVNYDAATGKWIVSILDIDLQHQVGYLNIAVSSTSDPNGAWTKFQVDLTDGHTPLIAGNSGLKLWGDFERFGSSANAYVWTVNMFSFSSGGIDQNSLFDHVQVIAVNKSSLSTVKQIDVPSWNSATGTITNENMLPVRMDAPTAADGMWFAEETNYGTTSGQASALQLVHVADILAPTPTFVDFTGNVPLYKFTFVPDGSTGGNHPWNNGDTNNNAFQGGSSDLIDTNDTRIDSAVWATINGQQHLVLTQTVEDPADPTTAKARWYDFNTTGATDPSVNVPLYQTGEINPGAGIFTYFPSAAIDPAGDIGMTYNESSSTELLSMYVTGKTLGESAMEPGLLAINNGPLTGPDTSPHRAGDYSGTVVDISSTGARLNSFWSGNQYGSGGHWGTVLETFSISNPVQPPVISSITADGQNPDTVTGTTSQLAVVASDPGGFGLNYSWSVSSGPSGVSFTNSAASSTGANFTQAGSYVFKVTVTDTQGASSSATVNVTVSQTVTSITVSPASATVADGATKQFSATAFDQFGHALTTQPTFAWSLASGGSNISSTGLYTAPSSGTGTDTVRAIVGTVTGTAGVTFNGPPVINSITADGQNPDTVAGSTSQLAVSATDPGGFALNYSWSVMSGPSGVSFTNNTASSTGASFTQAGSYVFKVTVTDSLGSSSTATVNVTVNQTVTTITVSPTSATVADGATQQFSATAFDQFSHALTTQPAFAWSLASAGTNISSTGLYTAPATGSGNDTVQATVGTVTGTASVTFTGAPPVISSITADGQNPDTVAGTTSLLAVSASDPGGFGLGYSWSATSGPSGVSFTNNTITTTGDTITANFTQAGSYVFQVTVTDSQGSSSSATVNVTVNQTVTSITVSPTSATVTDGGTKQFTATAFDQFGHALTAQPAFAWSLASGGTNIGATTGLYTAPATGSGTDTVQATVGTVTGTAGVTFVGPPVISSITADGQNPDTVAGTTSQLAVSASDPGGFSLAYSWSTSGPTGVTFTNNTITSTGDTITANFTQAGSYVFQVTVTDSQGASTSATVNVTVNQTVTSITVSPASATVTDGATRQFSATAFDQFGHALTTQPAFAWSLASGGTNISSTGLYTAPATGGGTDTVQATVGTVTGTASVTFVQPPIISASANPSPVTGKTTTLSVTASDPNPGGTITGYTWSLTSGPASVTITSPSASSTGVTFGKAGTYQFKVVVTDSYGLSSTSNVTVTVQQTLSSISLTPSSVTLRNSQTQAFTANAFDQFGNAMTTTPTFTWTWTGIGSFNKTSNTTLQYTSPPSATGTATITISVSGTSFTSTATITVRRHH